MQQNHSKVMEDLHFVAHWICCVAVFVMCSPFSSFFTRLTW